MPTEADADRTQTSPHLHAPKQEAGATSVYRKRQRKKEVGVWNIEQHIVMAPPHPYRPACIDPIHSSGPTHRARALRSRFSRAHKTYAQKVSGRTQEKQNAERSRRTTRKRLPAPCRNAELVANLEHSIFFTLAPEANKYSCKVQTFICRCVPHRLENMQQPGSPENPGWVMPASHQNKKHQSTASVNILHRAHAIDHAGQANTGKTQVSRAVYKKCTDSSVSYAPRAPCPGYAHFHAAETASHYCVNEGQPHIKATSYTTSPRLACPILSACCAVTRPSSYHHRRAADL